MIGGVVGGMGPLSSIRFYEECIRHCQEDLGLKANDEYPHLIITNTPVPDLINDTERVDTTVDMIRAELDWFVNGEIGIAAIACNTVHAYFNQIRAGYSLPVLNIVEESLAKLSESQVASTALLATPVTLQSQIYQSAFAVAGIEVVTPLASELEVLARVIPKLVSGDDVTSEIKPLVDWAIDSGADSVVLACTELGLVLNEEVLGKLTIEPLTLLARKTTDIVLGKRKIPEYCFT